MDIMSQFNLPKYLKGKSFSEASKLIADRFQDRNSPEDQATLKELQGRLRSAQEFVKAKQEAATQPQGEAMHQMPDGTMMPGAAHGEAVQEQPQQPQVDPAMMQAMQQAMPQQGQENSYKNGGNLYEDGGKKGKTKQLQKILVDEGYLTEDDVDGYWGDTTAAAYEEYENAFGLDRSRPGIIPLNVKSLFNDVTGIQSTIDRKSLKPDQLEALQEIVRGNLKKGKSTIDYADYNTETLSNADGTGGEQNSKMSTYDKMTDPNYLLKTVVGQGRIMVTPENDTLVMDQYNFNENDGTGNLDKMMDAIKKNKSAYNVARQIGGNFGSQEGEGANVLINTNEKGPQRELLAQMKEAQEKKDNDFKHGGYMKKKGNSYEHGGGHVGEYAPYGQFGQLSRFAMGPNGSLYRGLDNSRFNEGLSPSMGQDGNYAQLDGLGNRAQQGSRTVPFSPGFAAIGDAFNAQESAAAQKAKDDVQLQSDYEARKANLPGNATTLQPEGPNVPGAKAVADQALFGMTPGNASSFGRSFGSKFGSTPNTDIGFNQTMGRGKEDNFGGNAEGTNDQRSIFSGNDTNEDVNKKRSSKFNPGELLRYAAPASTAYQLATLKKPKDVSLGRLTDKYDEQFVDERAMQNVVEGQAANTRSALQNASGGSAAALRANLLGSQVQSQAAMSQAYNQAAAENRNERRQGQQFNSAVNQANMQQADREKEMNLAMRAGYDTNRSRLLAQLGADASGIGQEELFKRFPELAGLGYDYRGKKIK